VTAVEFALDMAKSEEREACAILVEGANTDKYEHWDAAVVEELLNDIARKIRARK
jgi:hypothetical protein